MSKIITMKKIPHNMLLGQKGINFIEQVVLSMGFLWYPTGAIEAGIDGTIEIRDEVTGQVTNSIILVQSKATEQPFTKETDTSFEFICDKRDLVYWMQGNAPVILVVSRPSTQEAYWVSIKDYFRDLKDISSGRVVFDKRRTQFDNSCKYDLLTIALRSDAGIYFSPQPKTETLYSNLLEVQQLPSTLFIAPTKHREVKSVWKVLRESGYTSGQEWLLKNKTIISLHDLTLPQWKDVCDIADIEQHSVDSWLDLEDRNRRREFVFLLNHCLRELLDASGIWYSLEKECYYFTATKDRSNRRVEYRSLVNLTDRMVFEARMSKKNPLQVSYYKHSAFEGQFRFFDSKWFLEINPTYYYTYDGRRLSHYYDEYLAGIKRLENNDAVLGQVVMWAELIRRAQNMLDAPSFVRFGDLCSFDADFGVDEDRWRSDPSAKQESSSEGSQQETLF